MFDFKKEGLEAIGEWLTNMQVMLAKAKEYDHIKEVLEVAETKIDDGKYLAEINLKIKKGVYFSFSEILKKSKMRIETVEKAKYDEKGEIKE